MNRAAPDAVLEVVVASVSRADTPAKTFGSTKMAPTDMQACDAPTPCHNFAHVVGFPVREGFK